MVDAGLASWCLSTTYIFNFPHSRTVEVKTVACARSPADGPLIVLKQTCRHWESGAPVQRHLAVSLNETRSLETSGESIAVCSCVSRLCVSCRCRLTQDKTRLGFIFRHLISARSSLRLTMSFKYEISIWALFLSLKSALSSKGINQDLIWSIKGGNRFQYTDNKSLYECVEAGVFALFLSEMIRSRGELAAQGLFGAWDLLSDLRCNGVHCWEQLWKRWKSSATHKGSEDRH